MTKLGAPKKAVMVREGGPPTTFGRRASAAITAHAPSMRYYYVYIITNRPNGTLYIGMTGDLMRRMAEHREGVVDGFAKTYALKHLVYYEIFEDPRTAIRREKRLKTWLRAWKVRLIRGVNPDWSDLSSNLINELPFT